MEGLRLTERERAVLIEQMRKAGLSDRRRLPRSIIEGSICLLLTMEYPGGSSARFRIYPWDLHKGGLAFLHRAFVYPGTRCTLTGDTFDHQPISIRGDVVRCDHVGGIVHSVGLKFEMDVDPEVFVGEQAAATLGQAAPPPPGAAPDKSADWWTALAEMAAEVAKLAQERAPADALRKRTAALVAQVNSAGGPRIDGPAEPGAAAGAPPAHAAAPSHN